ncbi:MAG: SDR family NAD(P)-dependent oxidoreductase [Acidimicrobiales bacterium]|nr:SDR family NAD(P)-dependent oxidoreductase [Acidimicrobiales bacterium]MCB1260753.1 SDR family NAD(P)-dependent oxidoreductase [Acidimicrobiales bacterium]
MAERRLAVVSGASSGIGAATAHALADAGFAVALGARRVERLHDVAAAIGPAASALPLDVTDQASVDAFCAALDRCDVLVNNAGGAKGLAPVADADDDHWRWMFETNVMGTMRMTRALLPHLRAGGDGHVIMVGSIAALEPYPGGAGYNAAKYGVRAMTSVLRQELLGEPVRVTEVDPGMVRTEFSEVRFEGDAARADAVYAGMTPLSAEDVAACIAFAATRPPHVNIDSMLVMARDQYGAQRVHRRDRGGS